MMLRSCIILFLFLLCSRDVTSQTGPPGCTYADGAYTCDYGTMSSSDRPIDYSQFSDTPQQLIVENSGLFPSFGDSEAFSSGFSGITALELDNNSPSLLTLDCGLGGSAYVSTGAFDNMGYIEHFKMKNCDILYIGTNTLDSFIELDYLSIEGGSIDGIEVTAFSGLSVQKTTSRTVTRALGKVDVRNTEFVNGVVDSVFLSYFTNVSVVSIRNAGVTALSRSMFASNTMIKMIDLSDNTFTELPGGFLSSLNSLSEMSFYNIPWDCSCDKLWWIETSKSQHITLHLDGMCTNLPGVTVLKYYHDNCAVTDVCEGITGFAMGDKCVMILGVIIMCFSILACVAAVVALILAIMNFKDLSECADDDVAEIDEVNPPPDKNQNTKPAGRPLQKPQPGKPTVTNQRRK